MSNLATLPERHSCVREVDVFFQYPIACVKTNATGEVGYTLYTAAEGLVSLWEALMTKGAQFNVQPIGWDALESLRIEAGIPRYGTELTDAVIPLEAELEHAIDFEKGCYIGQEIVARMKYRGHPNRLLRGIEINDIAQHPKTTANYVRAHGFSTLIKRSVGLRVPPLHQHSEKRSLWVMFGSQSQQQAVAFRLKHQMGMLMLRLSCCLFQHNL